MCWSVCSTKEELSSLGNRMLPNKESILDLVAQARSYRESDQLDKAKECLDKVLSRVPRNASALKEMTVILVRQREYDKAAAYLKKILEVKPGDLWALNELGIILRNQGNSRKAVELFNRVLEQDPNNMHTLSELGLTYNHLNEIDKADSCFEKISKQSSGMLTEKLKDLQSTRDSEKPSRERNVYLLASGRITTANAMATCFAHQINTPLQIIQGIIYRLLKKKEQIEKTEFINGLIKIQQTADTINAFTNHLNNLIKDDTEEHRFVKIGEVILGAFALFEQQLRYRRIKVDLSEIESDNGKTFVFGNRIELEHVFINLIANARDALENTAQRQIKVSFRSDERAITISFADNGQGISEENSKRIFESLFTTKPKGTGLGLWLCYSVIHGMSGKIEVKSRLGEGTTFIIRLPNKRNNYGET
jgi:signal transduction histidine kinase